MTEDEFNTRLLDLSVEQLEQVELALQEKIEDMEARKQQRTLPPRSDNDLENMASSIGLDISYLMREAKKRSR